MKSKNFFYFFLPFFIVMIDLRIISITAIPNTAITYLRKSLGDDLIGKVSFKKEIKGSSIFVIIS